VLAVNQSDNARISVVEVEIKHIIRQLAEHRAETQAAAASAKESREHLSEKLDALHALFLQAKGARWAIVAAASLTTFVLAVLAYVTKINFGSLPK